MNVKRILLLIFISVFLIFSASHYENKIFSPHFVDEEDNLVLGKYLLNNEKLYSDLFSHHQPLAYIISAGIQSTLEPNSIFLLIKRHREFIILWSVVWSVILVLAFGLTAALFVIIFESLKIFLFGNLFLSESLAVYPFIYLIFLIFKKEILSKVDLSFAGFCLSLVMMFLSPLWPALLFIFFLILSKIRKEWKNIFFLILGSFPILLISGNYSSILDYFKLTIGINFQHYIPMTSKDPWTTTMMNAFTTPILSFFSSVKNSQLLIIIQFLSFVYLIFNFFLLKIKEYKFVLLSFFILGLSNLRPSEIGSQYYGGFHALPWLGVLVVLTILSVFEIYKYKKPLKIILVLALTALIGLSLSVSSNTLFIKHDINKDFYVNYSRQFDFGNAVKIMKREGDTLMVVPDEWLIYWEADIKHRSKMLNYYAWMSAVPELNSTVEDSFKKDAPTFLYCECIGGYYGLEKYFDQYNHMKKDGKDTSLLILKEKINRITPEQKTKLDYYNIRLD